MFSGENPTNLLTLLIHSYCNNVSWNITLFVKNSPYFATNNSMVVIQLPRYQMCGRLKTVWNNFAFCIKRKKSTQVWSCACIAVLIKQKQGI